MGMNLFFRAFTQAQIDQMAADHNVIDKLVEDRQYAFEGCIDTAWDVLRCVLDGAGTSAGDFVDEDEPADLLEHFDALVAFYRDAAAKGLAAISYHA